MRLKVERVGDVACESTSNGGCAVAIGASQRLQNRRALVVLAVACLLSASDEAFASSIEVIVVADRGGVIEG